MVLIAINAASTRKIRNRSSLDLKLPDMVQWNMTSSPKITAADRENARIAQDLAKMWREHELKNHGGAFCPDRALDQDDQDADWCRLG